MKRYRWTLFTSLMGLMLLACSLVGVAQQTPQSRPAVTPAPAIATVNPTAVANTTVPTTDPLASAKACLANTWEIADISSSVIAAIPPELAQQYDLQYKGASGKGVYTLTEDGNILMQADQMELQFTAKTSLFSVPVTVAIDGQARGRYTLQGNTLTTSDMDTSGLTASAQAIGQDIVTQEQIFQAIPLISPSHNTAEYSCAGDTLQLKVSSFPDTVPPLVFHKIN